MSDQPAQLERKGYLRSLFDFSFSSLITRRVIRTLYILITIVYSLGALVAFASLLANHSPVAVVAAVVIVPIGYLIYLTIARVMLEVLMVIFDIGEDVRQIRVLRSNRAEDLGTAE
jgi:Domain of unknown function (DUF4282)